MLQNNQVFISGGLDKRIYLWNITHGQVVCQVDIPDVITACAFLSSKGEQLIVGTDAGRLLFYDTEVTPPPVGRCRKCWPTYGDGQLTCLYRPFEPPQALLKRKACLLQERYFGEGKPLNAGHLPLPSVLMICSFKGDEVIQGASGAQFTLQRQGSPSQNCRDRNHQGWRICMLLSLFSFLDSNCTNDERLIPT